MKKVFVCLCIILCFGPLIFGQPVDSNLKLELVQVLFRHGTRTAIEREAKLSGYFNDSLYDPWGLKQLTKEGMIQEYEIGKMLRERYIDFLSNQYQPRHVYAYTSNTDRTKASLGLVLAALYPPSEELRWNDNFNWIPIPTHSTPYYLDILMRSRNCPVYKELLEKQINSKDLVQTLLSHGEIFKMLEEIYKQPFDLHKIFSLYNLLKIHKNLKLPLPYWYTNEVFESLKNTSEFYLNVLSSTNTLKKLNGGPLVKTLLNNINNLNQYEKKIYLYSSHDKNLHAYMKAHNIKVQHQPDYGSSIILETYSDSNNELFVKMLYWNGEPKQLKTLKLDSCSELCPLESYYKIVKSVLPSEDEMLCLLKNLTPKELEKHFYSINMRE